MELLMTTYQERFGKRFFRR